MKHEVFNRKTLTKEGQNDLRKIRNYIDKYSHPIVVEIVIEGHSLTTGNNAVAEFQKNQKPCEEEVSEEAKAADVHSVVKHANAPDAEKPTESLEAVSDSN